MNDQQQHYLTSEGAAKLKVELVQLKGPARDELAQRLRSAIQMGDLSENADYHKAKEDQAFLEGRIQELEYLLKNATIIADNTGPHAVVEIGARITVGRGFRTRKLFAGWGERGRPTQRKNFERIADRARRAWASPG